MLKAHETMASTSSYNKNSCLITLSVNPRTVGIITSITEEIKDLVEYSKDELLY